ncbi:hypothetical protein ACM44_07430, partial [Chryseobacterium koreense CCUG 49689]
GTVEVSGTLEADFLDAGFVVEPGVLNASLDASVVSFVPFGVYKHRDKLIDGVMVCFSAFNRGLEGAVHAVELHLFHFGKGGFVHNLDGF